jgi:hypothetical protein
MNDVTNALCVIVCVLQQYTFIKYMWVDYNSLILLMTVILASEHLEMYYDDLKYNWEVYKEERCLYHLNIQIFIYPR